MNFLELSRHGIINTDEPVPIIEDIPTSERKNEGNQSNYLNPLLLSPDVSLLFRPEQL